MSQTEIPMIDHVSAIADRYDAIISDVWGVLHNGIKITEPANHCLQQLRKRGLAVSMLTNAPRPPADIITFIEHLGGTQNAWTGFVSSGGVTRQLVAERGDRPFLHIGPDRDRSLFTGLTARETTLADADYVLCSGLVDDETETAETYRPDLEHMLKRNLEMICANPDIVVERGHRLIPCGGAIADLYERMGGKVLWVGKPHPLVYDVAKAEIEKTLGRPVDKSRILGIGDALRTDVAGAINYGIDCLMVLDGIHSAELGAGRDFSPGAINAFLTKAGVRPAYTTRLLTY